MVNCINGFGDTVCDYLMLNIYIIILSSNINTVTPVTLLNMRRNCISNTIIISDTRYNIKT